MKRETAGAVGNMICLLCGERRRNVRGAIVDEEMVKQVPRMRSSRAMLGGHGGEVCFVYGEGGETFVGRSIGGKPIFSARPPG